MRRASVRSASHQGIFGGEPDPGRPDWEDRAYARREGKEMSERPARETGPHPPGLKEYKPSLWDFGKRTGSFRIAFSQRVRLPLRTHLQWRCGSQSAFIRVRGSCSVFRKGICGAGGERPSYSDIRSRRIQNVHPSRRHVIKPLQGLHGTDSAITGEFRSGLDGHIL